MKKRISIGQIVSFIFGVVRDISLLGEVADWVEELFKWN
uniref:Uncharacterized protein n=1 Tax=Vibrio tasmaniensis TaxID=212663 RepID=A0A0H4A2I2_9VIBR|nr:hypothetical protein [Vibrio tasmaniensis]